MKYVRRESGKVVEIAQWPIDGASEERLSDDHADVLAYLDPPASTDPKDYPLNPFQFFTFLEQIGLNEAAVDAAIDVVEPDDMERIKHKRRFRHATAYRRNHPLLVSLISAVGKTPAEIDTAWMAAKDLQ